MSQATLIVKVDSTEVSRGKKSLDDLADSGGRADQSAKQLTGSTTSLASAAKIAAGALAAMGVFRGFGNAVSVTADFSQAIADLSAITGATGKDLEYYKAQAADIGRTTSLSATQATTAFKLIASAKPDLLSNAEALNAVTRSAVTLAEATGQDLPTAAKALGSALNQFSLDASKADEVINMLAASSKLGTAEVGSVSEALRNAGPAANALGIDITETVAAIQALAKSGREGADAGTGLRQMMLALEKTGDESLMPSLVGISGALDELGRRNMSVNDLMGELGVDAATVTAAMIEQRSTVSELNVTLRDTDTAYEQAAIRQDTFRGDMKALGSVIEGLQIAALGVSVDDLGRSMVQTATGGVSFLIDNMDTLKTLTEAVAVIIGVRLTSALITSTAAQISKTAASLIAIGVERTAAATELAGASAANTLAAAHLKSTAALVARSVGMPGHAALVAKLAASESAATVAANAHTAAMARSTAAGSAKATVMRGLGGVMAMLGGPTGLLLIAAAGTVYLANKFIGAKRETKELANEVDALTGQIIKYNNVTQGAQSWTAKLQGEITSLRQEMDYAELTYGSNSAEVEALNLEMAELERQLRELTGVTVESTAAVVANTAVVASASKAVYAYGKNVDIATDAADAHVQAQEAYIKTQEEAAKKTEASKQTVDNMITALENDIKALGMTSRAQAIFNAELKALANGAGPEAIARIRELEAAKYDAAAAATKLGADTTAAAKSAEDNWQRTHEYLSTTFVDIWNNGKGAFRNLADSFTAMIKRMVAEWAASKLMNLMGFGSGSGGSATSIISNLFGGGGSGGGGGGFSVPGAIKAASTVSKLAGIGGTAATAANTVGPLASGYVAAGTTAATGGGIVASVTGGLSAAGSAVVGGVSAAGSAAMTALSAIPGWGWALAGAALAAKLLDSGGTMSGNAGFLIHDAPGVSADRKFDVPAFASGFDPVGFARREDQAAATQVIDVFRADDAALTEIAKRAGITVNYANAPFGGYNEKGNGNGIFFGTANEDGKNTAVSIEAQRAKFVADWLRDLHGKAAHNVDQSLINDAISAGSANAMIARAAQIAGVANPDGSHRNGLDFVPFDGYRAELHRGERVQTASQAKDGDKMSEQMKETKQEMTKVRGEIQRLQSLTESMYRIFDKWDGIGLPREQAAT